MSAEWEPSPSLDRVKKLVEEGDEWWVEYRTSYSGYREFGTGPAVGHGSFMPPLEPILLWVNDKLGISGKKAMEVAQAIRWSIYQKGTMPEPFARPAVAEAEMRLSELLGDTCELRKVAEFVAERSREIIDATQTDSGMLASEIYVVHRRTE